MAGIIIGILVISIIVLGAILIIKGDSKSNNHENQTSRTVKPKTSVSEYYESVSESQLNEYEKTRIKLNISNLTDRNKTLESKIDNMVSNRSFMNSYSHSKRDYIDYKIITGVFEILIQRLEFAGDRTKADKLTRKLNLTKELGKPIGDEYKDIIEYWRDYDNRDIEAEMFQKYLEKYKDYSAMELEQLIEINRKEDYNLYSTEDKQKYRAMKTLIERMSDGEFFVKFKNGATIRGSFDDTIKTSDQINNNIIY